MLPKKLDAISIAGFTAIELSFRDILSFGKLHLEHDVSPTNYDELCTVAAEIKRLCDNKGLEITTLQPFPNSEGWPEGSNERKDAFDRAHRWIRIMEACKTDMLQARFDLSHFQLQIHSRITGRSERVYQLLTSRLHKPAPPILLSWNSTAPASPLAFNPSLTSSRNTASASPTKTGISLATCPTSAMSGTSCGASIVPTLASASTLSRPQAANGATRLPPLAYAKTYPETS